MQRPEFEAVLWELAPRTASPDSRERIHAHEAIMRAFDRSTGQRTARLPKGEDSRIRAAAEACRLYAMAANQDTPVVTAGRRAELEAALNSLPPGWPPRRDSTCHARERTQVA